MGRANTFGVSVVVCSVLVFSLGLSLIVHADMGRVYVSSEAVTVSEDAQKAIILHNLKEEVLVLGTDLKASKKTGIIRFIPFPSEPDVVLAPDGAFEKASAMIKKYGLKYQHYFHTKGGPPTSVTEGVELCLNKKLGAHDMTVIKVNDTAAFRKWVNGFFKSKGLPVHEKYPEEEAVVDNYVKRGIRYFAFDFVEVSTEPRFIEPVAYRFRSRELYYPLVTSNTFGGQGRIELIIIAPTTLCAPGNEPLDPYSGSLYREERPGAQRPYGQRPLCFGIPVKASTSALLVKEEKDLDGIYPGGEDFFKGQDSFIQVVSYTGKYFFTDDIFVDVSAGLPHAAGVVQEEQGNPWYGKLDFVDEALVKKCSRKPDRGPCKGLFKKYYFDPASGTCKSFFWGGCDGVVPFETEEDCRECIGNGMKGTDPGVAPQLPGKGAARAFAAMEWEGKVSGQKEEFIKVVTSREEWTGLWKRAFDKPAPRVDFEHFAVACVFLGHSAEWLYSIDFGEPEKRGSLLVIPYGTVELILELSGPFKAGGQYRMKVFERKKGLEMIIQGTTDSPKPGS